MPSTLNTNDSATASDHPPVQIVFNHPYVQPFRITAIVRSNQSVTRTWESVPGQTYTVESAITPWVRRMRGLWCFRTGTSHA